MGAWEQSVKLIPTIGLLDLVRDAELRIGSHVAGGNQVDDYVERQRTLISIVQEELQKRRGTS